MKGRRGKREVSEIWSSKGKYKKLSEDRLNLLALPCKQTLQIIKSYSHLQPQFLQNEQSPPRQRHKLQTRQPQRPHPTHQRLRWRGPQTSQPQHQHLRRRVRRQRERGLHRLQGQLLIWLNPQFSISGTIEEHNGSLNNYIDKMESKMFKELTDFTDLRRKNEQFQSNSSKQSTAPPGGDLDAETNEMIMKSFRQLRQRLKISQRQTQVLRQQIKTLQIDSVQLHQSQTNLRSLNHQLKQKNSHSLHATDEMKKKFMLMKASLSDRDQLQQQLHFMKDNVLQLQLKCEKLQEEKKKVIEISIQEKMQLEEKINKMEVKGESDERYLQEMEREMGKGRESIMKLENMLKKIEIKYDEEIFNKQWQKDNFQKEKYEQHIRELEGQVGDLRSKHRKDKQKRAEIEKRVIELEEISGMWNVKAEAYQGQADLMSKKVKKLERRMSQAKTTANKMATEKIHWEQRFYKSVFISEQLINRVKRELMGDMVELAKTCEFRINKLKEGKDAEVMGPSAGKELCLAVGKKMNRSDKKVRKSHERQFYTLTKNIETFPAVITQTGRGILTQSKTNLELSEVKQKLTFEQRKVQSFNQNGEQNQSRAQQVNNLQLKIRRQRQQMQKKLKERMMFRKLQACNSPQKSKLRENYLELMLDK